MSSVLLQYLKNQKIGANLRALSDFLTSIVAKQQKNEGEPLWDFFPKKSHNAETNLKRGPFRLARYCMLLFWFNSLSLGQMVQFNTKKFCRPL